MAETFTTLRARGRPFQKGMKKLGGRPKGSPNVQTKAVKEMLACAANRLGGIQRLVEWAKEDPRNEYAFWVFLWPRLLPLQFAGSGPHGEIELNVKLSAEELSKQLAERNLPHAVFGIDKPPVLELEAARCESIESTMPAVEDPAPMLEAIEQQICAPDSASAGDQRAFLETRMRSHIARHSGGGSN
jgi:hypothetical protein